MENHAPYVGIALGLWAVLLTASVAVVRRALFAFMFGVLFTGAFVAYCVHYQGPVEMAGVIHGFCGGIYGVLVFHLILWLRSRFRRSEPESPNPTLQRMPGSASISKPDAAGPAPLS
jgi:hypothetical protein